MCSPFLDIRYLEAAGFPVCPNLAELCGPSRRWPCVKRFSPLCLSLRGALLLEGRDTSPKFMRMLSNQSLFPGMQVSFPVNEQTMLMTRREPLLAESSWSSLLAQVKRNGWKIRNERPRLVTSPLKNRAKFLKAVQ